MSRAAQGGHLLLAFQVGDGPLHLTEPFGHPVSPDFRRRPPDRIAVRARVVREPEEGRGATPQACLILRRPAAAGGS
ncbi:hypothetical protein [Streptomyces decoyicus]|uniref:hypothetical protein n=1 Tax=Streptomyces decoyicus TaxID=249567 RepID=UPI0004AB0575|nr:hypothetical protein K7C20_14265 [Streptomyces decoyicus]